jgi:hypothetical protein
VLPEQIPSINLGKLLGNIDILLKPVQRFFQPTGCGESVSEVLIADREVALEFGVRRVRSDKSFEDCCTLPVLSGGRFGHFPSHRYIPEPFCGNGLLSTRFRGCVRHLDRIGS